MNHKKYKNSKFRIYSTSECLFSPDVPGFVVKSALNNICLENRTTMNTLLCSFNMTCLLQLKVKISKY